MSDQDLEVVLVAGEPIPVVPAKRRRRWPWALGATVAVLVALAFPVRTALAHAEVDRLERAWADLVALDASRDTLVNRLVSESVPTDAVALRQATIGLDEEEVTRVLALRRSLPANRFDHGASKLRDAVANGFDREVAGLRASIASLKQGTNFLPSQLYATSIDFGAVQAQIDSQRRRFGEDLHRQHQSSAALHSADATLAAFAHFSSVPVGVRLVVTTNFGVRLLDIDRSTDSAADLGPDTRTIIANGSVYAISQGRVFRLPADLSGNGHDLGPGAIVIPAPSGQLWISTDDDSLRLVSSDGQTVWGPQPVTFAISGTVDAGVVTQNGSLGFAVVNPQTGAVVRQLDAQGATPFVLAATGDTVIYTHNHDADVHVATVSTGQVIDIPVSSSVHPLQSGVGALSPDGRWLATYAVGDSGTATPVVVNLQTRSVTQLTNVGNPDLALSMAWTADSERLFFTVNADGASLATWHVGESSATVLRWRSATASSVAVLP